MSRRQRCESRQKDVRERCILPNLHEGDHEGETMKWLRSKRGRPANGRRDILPREWLPEAQFLYESGCTADEIAAGVERTVATVSREARRVDKDAYAELIAAMDLEIAYRKRKGEPGQWAA